MKFPDYNTIPVRFFDNPEEQRNYALSHQRVSDSLPRKYKINIIGCGMIGREHIGVASLLGRATVHGIFDTSLESIAKAKQEFASYSEAQLHEYESLEEACSDKAVDALFICTPNFTHFDILQTALKSGKALFVEKPMATDLVDAARIVTLAETYSGFIQLGMQYRYKSQYSEAFYQVKKLQALGDVKTISMSEYRPPFLDKVEQWNKFNENSGGTLLEKCCHYFDLINMMAESTPVKVFATGGQAVNFVDFVYDGKSSDIDDHAFVIIEYANGVKANFTLNMFCPELEERLVVTGDGGRLIASEKSSFVDGRTSKATLSLEVDAVKGAEVMDLTYAPLVERSGHHGATFFEHLALIERLEGGEPDSATPLQGLWALIVASAAQESIRLGSPVLIQDYLNTLEIKDC